MTDRCIEKVWNGWQPAQCSRKGGHGPNGAYCKQHDHDAKAARSAERDAKWRAEYDAKYRMANFNAECTKYVRAIAAGMTDEGAAKARQIVAALEAAS